MYGSTKFGKEVIEQMGGKETAVYNRFFNKKKEE